MQTLSAFDETSAFTVFGSRDFRKRHLADCLRSGATSEVCHGWTLMPSSSDSDSRTGLLELVFLRVLAKQKPWTMPRRRP